MSLPKDIEPFRAAIESIQCLLGIYHQHGVIIGGIAVGFLGKPRLTEDVDALFLLSLKDIPEFLRNAKTEGIEPRIQKVEDFAHRSRVLLLKHSITGINIDISLGILPFEEEMVARSSLQNIGTFTVRLPTPEDLIIMKVIAHRPKDIEDIRTILSNHPKLDTARIEYWVRQFAEVLEMPELWKDIAGLFK